MEIIARTCNTGMLAGERTAARLFAGLGAVIWSLLAIALFFNLQTPNASMLVIMVAVPLVLSVLALALGWFYENLGAALLFAGAIGTVVWGFVEGWEPGVWGITALILIAPEIVAGVLFLMAARMQEVCLLEQKA
ncbi:MAG TPA: hypothetical protein VIK85_05995 [Coriobacteriia bacterium]